MGKMIGKVHVHDMPEATEELVDFVWNCGCAQKFRCVQEGTGNSDVYGWRFFNGYVDWFEA